MLCFPLFNVSPASPFSCIKLVSLIKRARDSLAAMAMGWRDVPVSVPAGDARDKVPGEQVLTRSRWHCAIWTEASGPGGRLALCGGGSG